MSAAAFLARAGHQVIFYDKAPEPAPVGSGLIVQPTGQAVLAALGSLDALKQLGARLDRLDGRLPGGTRKVLDVRYEALGSGVHGLSVHRAVLFDLLLQAALDNGATLEMGKDVTSADHTDRRFMFSDDTQSPTFDLIIDALGVRSPLVQRANAFLDFGALWGNAPFPSAHGFDKHVLSQRYSSANISSGVMPIGMVQEGGEEQAAFFWTLRADAYEAWRAAPLDQWKENVLVLWPDAKPFLMHFTSHDQFVFAHYAHHTVKHPVEGRVVHIGDAWHAASPQLGQGANMALLDAWALSKALREEKDVDTALKRFLHMRQTHVQLYQTISHLFTPVYQSDQKLLPALRDILAEPLSGLWPMPRILAALVAGMLGDPLKPLGLS